MKKLSILILLLLIGAGCDQQHDKDIIQGKTEKEEIAVTGKIPGRINRILVNEGDFVKKGDTLAVLNIPEVEAKKAQALGALESAKAQYSMSVTGASQPQLTQLRSKKSALSEQYTFAEKSVNRLKNMVKDSLIPQQQYDEAYAKYQGAQAKLKAVKAEIAEVKNGVRLEKQTMALGQKNSALGALQEVNAAEIERFVLAPTNMAVQSITLKAGELALPGYTLFKGPIPEGTYFRFTLPENRLNEIEKGMEIKVHVVYKNKDINGTITTIKQLPAYADISTAYPDYEMEQSLFEIKVVPNQPEEVKDIFANTTITLKL